MMKKIFLSLSLLLFLGAGAQAQVIVNSNITTNTTWTSNNIYLLQGGFIYVTNNAILTIEPGTLIKGQASSLVITRGAKIIAQGTSAQPIVFTSYQPAGSRATGDWGGILLLGRAPINDPAGQRLAEGGIDATLGLYGGTDPNDNSGILSYVRIEYAGIAFQPNNETNGLTCGAVGLGTQIDHVMVSFGGDDSFEFFGGTVDAKYLISYRGVDDEFDTDYGFSGHLQYILSLRDSSFADVSGSNGFESDNDATGTTNAPLTKAIITNATIVGPKRTLGTTVHTNYRRGAHLRRSSSQCLYNSLVMGYPVGLKIENQNTANNANSGTLQWKNNIIAGCPQSLDSAGLTGFGMLNWYNANGNSTLTNVSDLMLTNPYNFSGTPDFRPAAGSPALSGASWTSPNLNYSFFNQTTYRGAFDGTTDWTACWANWSPQTTPYTTPGISNLSVTVNPSGATTFCQGDTVILSAVTTATTYNWSNSANTSSINVTTSGTYTVTVSNASGCSAVSTPIVVTVNPLPAANVSPGGPTTFCQGGSVILTSTSGTTYLWNNNSSTQSILATTSGSYIVTVTDANGCSNSSTPVVVTVNALPTATATPNGNTSFCTGDSLEICATGGTGFLWSTAEMTSCIWVNATGAYNVQVTDANGCTSPVSNTVNVNVSATPPPTVNVSGDSVLCDGETVELCSSPADSYLWSNGDTTQCITVNAADVYYVSVTNANQCDGIGLSGDVTITVNAAPTAAFTSSGFYPTLTFTNASTGATAYTWDFGDGNSSSQASPTHFYQTEGTYTVCLVAENASGCTDTLCTSVDVLTALEPVQAISSMQLFPNPAELEATLELTLADHAALTVQVISLTGEVIFTQVDAQPASHVQYTLDLSRMPAGMYLVKATTATSTQVMRLAVVH